MASKLANKIWKKHENVFWHFDLVNNNGGSLGDETKSVALFNALTTLKQLKKVKYTKEIRKAIKYLKGSKYYSEDNSDSKY